MTGDEIRKAFLDFFIEKGHAVVPSSSLIPRGDPTLLLTTAGMVQFKPYFLGIESPPNPRLVSCQKCFRTTDIESVGDANHLTFFEMLGNFSIGDYFKRETINWSWEFVTERLGLSPGQLWITIFLDDDESFDIWRELGVPEHRIVRFGEEDNFWGPAGSSGPCGPCSEIHYDFGPDAGCGRPSCTLGCKCGRFSEIWNLVFTQFDQDTEGRRVPLSRRNIDTGMGLERIAAVMQGKNTVYETDLFSPLIRGIERLVGREYGVDDGLDNAMRIVAEHGRGITFLIADGVVPSNEGRGYVLRRLLRRAALFSRQLGPDKPFLTEVVRVTIAHMGQAYPETVARQDFILRLIEDEEARFRRTLNTGLELLDGIMEMLAAKGEKEIPGKNLFKLYDTYGFPVELTREIASGRGFSVDMAGFEKEMAAQRQRARASHKFEADMSGELGLKGQLTVETTPFIGYDQLEGETNIISIVTGDRFIDTIQTGQEAGLILEVTPFYGEMGGQVGDTGQIIGPGGEFVVTDTIHLSAEVILHQGRITRGHLAKGDKVSARVDRERRLDIARNHTATHLLHSALRRVLGEHVEQRGSLVSPERLRFDFSHLSALTREKIKKIQQLVNSEIRQNLPVSGEEMHYKKAITAGAIALFGEKYGDTVRVITVSEPAVSAELCGGTHVPATGEIGSFQIVSESSIGAGLRRIEAVTGRGAETLVERQLAMLEQLASLLKVSLAEVSSAVSRLLDEKDTEYRKRQALEKELSLRMAESLLSKTEKVNDVNVLAETVPALRLEVLREMSDWLRDRLKNAVIVLGTVQEDKPVFLAAVSEDLVAKGYHAGEIVKQVARVAGGGGGGKATLAQAGGKHKEKLAEAMGLVKKLVKSGGR